MRLRPRDPAWLLTLAVGGAALLVSATLIGARLAVPSEAAVIPTEAWPWSSDGVAVEPLDSDSPFRSGDVVIAMDGRPLVEWAEAAVVPPWLAGLADLGPTIDVEVRRDGRSVSLTAPRLPLSRERFAGAPIALLVFGAGVLVLALVLVIRRPRATALRVLFVGTTANTADIVAWELDLQPGDLALESPFLPAFGLAAAFSLLFWSSLVHILSIYPSRSSLLVRRPWLVPALYVGPMLAFALGIVLARVAGGTVLDWIDRLAAVVAAVVSVMVGLLIASVIAGYRRISIARRRQVRWIAATLLLAASATLLLVSLPIVVGGQPLVPRNTIAILALPVPIALAVAVARDRLFQVDLLASSRERIVAAREDERRRLRRELHDGLGPTLAAMGLKLDLVRERLRTDPDAAEATIDELRSGVRAVIADIRQLVRELRPPALDSLGLVGAIRQQADAIGGPLGAGPVIMVRSPDSLPALPAAVEVAAYRIAVEALLNAVRHAGATSCEVRLAVDDEGLEIEVTDDGRGIAAGASGVGTRAMDERAAEVGGEVTIERQPGGGTRVVARLPFDVATGKPPR